MKFLVSVFNSKLIYFWSYYNGKKQGEQLQIDRDHLIEIPIIKSENKEIIEAVDSLIDLNKRLESINLDREKELIKKQIEVSGNKVDEIVYDLCGLSKDEKEVIRSFGSK